MPKTVVAISAALTYSDRYRRLRGSCSPDLVCVNTQSVRIGPIVCFGFGIRLPLMSLFYGFEFGLTNGFLEGGSDELGALPMPPWGNLVERFAGGIVHLDQEQSADQIFAPDLKAVQVS